MKKLILTLLLFATALCGAQTFPVNNLQINGQVGGNSCYYVANAAAIRSVTRVMTVGSVAASVKNVCTQGYYTAGDGNGGTYTLISTTSSGYTDNGGTVFIASDGSVWGLAVRNGFLRVGMFGAYGDNSHDDTTAIMNAISASGANGGYGTIVFDAGKVYKYSHLTLDGTLGLQFKGGNGGNVGNLSTSSSGGAATLACTTTSANCIDFTGVAYHAAQLVFEDLMFVGSTTQYILNFNNASQIQFNRVTVSNSGGNAYNTGNGIHFSNTYYVYADRLYVWKQGTLYTQGQGIVIDMGALSSFLGGLYNFTNCSIYGFYAGLIAGDQTTGATANENYASINFINSELNSNSQGANIYYGVKNARFEGNYVEGNLVSGILLANQPRTVSIVNNFFNNSTASSADVVLGQNGNGVSYTQFYGVEIKNNYFLGVNKYGVISVAGAGSSVDVAQNTFVLGTTGAVAVNIGQQALGNVLSTASNNSFYGFPVGTSMAGFYTTQTNNIEFNTSGTLIGQYGEAAVVLNPYVVNTSMQTNDPTNYVITNSSASAKFFNLSAASSKNRKSFVTLTAASTQSLLIYNSATTTLLCTLTAGKAAWVWNDGTNEYCSLLP